jgi:hypothetical protein
MHKERLNKLFETFDPAVKSVILGVLDIEQEHTMHITIAGSGNVGRALADAHRATASPRRELSPAGSSSTALAPRSEAARQGAMRSSMPTTAGS